MKLLQDVCVCVALYLMQFKYQFFENQLLLKASKPVCPMRKCVAFGLGLRLGLLGCELSLGKG